MANRYEKIIDKFPLHDWNDRSQRIPISEQHLLDVEANLGHQLPKDYRNFVQNYGGISFSEIVFPLATGQELDEASISGFNDSNTEENLFETYQQSINNFSGDFDYTGPADGSKSIKWPPELLPVGYDSQLNLICIALFGPQCGAIFFCLSNPMFGEQHAYLIANSFDEFLNTLSFSVDNIL